MKRRLILSLATFAATLTPTILSAAPDEGHGAPSAPAPSVTLSNPPCAVENVYYEMADMPIWQIGFGVTNPRPTAASDLLMVVIGADFYRNYAFSSAQGFGGASLLLTEEVPGSGVISVSEEQLDEPLRFNAFSVSEAGGVTMLIDPPQAGDPAPAALYLPDLSRHYWYDESSVDPETGETVPDRVDIPRALFLPTCLDPAE